MSKSISQLESENAILRRTLEDVYSSMHIFEKILNIEAVEDLSKALNNARELLERYENGR